MVGQLRWGSHDLVTSNAEPGGKLVYGNAATTVIVRQRNRVLCHVMVDRKMLSLRHFLTFGLRRK